MQPELVGGPSRCSASSKTPSPLASRQSRAGVRSQQSQKSKREQCLVRDEPLSPTDRLTGSCAALALDRSGRMLAPRSRIPARCTATDDQNDSEPHEREESQWVGRSERLELFDPAERRCPPQPCEPGPGVGDHSQRIRHAKRRARESQLLGGESLPAGSSAHPPRGTRPHSRRLRSRRRPSNRWQCAPSTLGRSTTEISAVRMNRAPTPEPSPISTCAVARRFVVWPTSNNSARPASSSPRSSLVAIKSPQTPPRTLKNASDFHTV